MSRLVLTGALIFVVVAVAGLVIGAVGDQPPRLEHLLLQSGASALVLAPVARLLLQRTDTQDVDESAESKEEFSNIDPVSNTLNLRGLTINLLESMALAERYDRDLAIVMLSVDDIMSVETNHGGTGIEAVLQMMGDTLVEALRIPDRAGRYQDNTFLLILPETDSAGAKKIAERVRVQIVDTDVRPAQGDPFKVTASAGVAPFRSGDDPQLIIQRAQSALAEARQLGQNQTVALA